MKKTEFVKKVSQSDLGLWEKKEPLLGYLDIELTERCNNDCIHCYNNLPAADQKIKKKELTTSEWKAIIEEAASLGCLRIRFTGGEPLLREDFEDLYLFARKLGVRVVIFTNATLITPHIAEVFAQVPPLDKIEITVYGMTKTSYEKNSRKAGSFEAAFSGIHRLRENNIPFVVKGAFLPANRGEIKEFETWARTIPWMENCPPYSLFFNLRYRRDSDEKNNLIKKLRASADEGLKMLIRNESGFYDEMKEFCGSFMGPSGDKLFSCGAGTRSGCVDAYGFFSPCLLLKAPETSYSLKSGSIRDALQNFFPSIRERKAENHDYLKRCSRCFLHGLCSQCPARSWMEHGYLDSPVDYLCQIAHAKACHLGLLKKGEKGWEVKNWKKRTDQLNSLEIKKN